MIDLEIGVVGQGKVNAGDKYVVCKLENMDDDCIRPRGFTLFKEQAPRRFEAILNAFPSTGNNPKTNKPWNGTNAEIQAADFNYDKAVAGLQNVGGKNYIQITRAKYIKHPLPGYYVRKYNQAMAGHEAGEWIMEPNGTNVQVIDEIQVLTRWWEDGTEPIEGWDAATQAKSMMKTLIRLEDALGTKDVKGRECIVAKRYLPDAEVIVPNNDTIDDK